MSSIAGEYLCFLEIITQFFKKNGNVTSNNILYHKNEENSIEAHAPTIRIKLPLSQKSKKKIKKEGKKTRRN